MLRANPYVISVVSGKGGTGKTLITAMLADILAVSTEARVLVVDMDIYVRGLTALLFKPLQQNIIAQPHQLVVADLFSLHSQKALSVSDDSSTAYKDLVFTPVNAKRSFDILPAVRNLNDQFSLSALSICGIDASVDLVDDMLTQIRHYTPPELDYNPESPYYDYIFLDCRAGYDDLIAATHLLSDLTICVDEDDPISSVTAQMLTNQLINISKECYHMVKEGYSKYRSPQEYSESELPEKLDHISLVKYASLIRIKNKDRKFKREDITDEDHYRIEDLVSPISLPYDADVLDSFGQRMFWTKMGSSQYRTSLCYFWNAINEKHIQNDEHYIAVHPVSETITSALNSFLGKLSSSSRFFFSGGILLIMIALQLMLLNDQVISLLNTNPAASVSFFSIVFGCLIIFLSIVNLNFFLKPIRKLTHLIRNLFHRKTE